MFLVQFTNGKFLGVTMSQSLTYAHNINFAHCFPSIDVIKKAAKFFQLHLNESVYTITDLSGNPVESINPEII